jgi:hypothetical protein
MERNVFETELNGKKIGFKFGTLAVSIACREAKAKSVQELIAMMASEDLLASVAMFYGGAIQYKESRNIKDDINPDTVSDWIEQMGEEIAGKATAVMLEKLVPKNLQALQVGAMENQ